MTPDPGGPRPTPYRDPAHLVAGWGFPAAAAWLVRGAAAAATGDPGRPFPWASVTKVVTALAIWVAVEEGTLSWDDEVGPPGATLRHLLAHASGLAPDDDEVLAAPGRRRIYSNRGIEIAAGHLAARSAMSFAAYVGEAVLGPLGMHGTDMSGSPAAGGSGPIGDLAALARELLEPTLVDRATLEEATAVAFPGLAGVLPGYGRLDPNDWGLGVEIRGTKSPHWTGALNSPRTFGHFGRSGSFLWVDPVAGVAACALAAQPFGRWAVDAWPVLSDAVLGELRSPDPPPSP